MSIIIKHILRLASYYTLYIKDVNRMDPQVSVLAFWSQPCWFFGIKSDHISKIGRRVKPLDYF